MGMYPSIYNCLDGILGWILWLVVLYSVMWQIMTLVIYRDTARNNFYWGKLWP